METNEPTLILVPGHWLGAWAWTEVADALAARGRRAVPVTLPGLDPDDPDRTTRTLGDQAAYLERVLDEVGGPAVLVGHSGANQPVSLVLDRRAVARVVWVDSGPVAPGTVVAPDLPDGVAELPLPSFEVLGEQASLAGLDADALGRFRDRAVPMPGPVLREAVTLVNPARRRVPSTFVCCSIAGAQVRELAEAGHPMFAEVAELADVAYVDLPTGHWPMWSRPTDLAGVLDEVTRV